MADPRNGIVLPDGSRTNGEHAAPEFQSPDFSASTLTLAKDRGVHPDIESFLSQIVADEGLLMDLCFEKAIDIAERNIAAKRVGIDNFIEQGIPPVVIAAQLAVPMAIKLFEESSRQLERPELADKLTEIVRASKKTA